MQQDGVRTITKKDLAERIADKTGLSRTQVRDVLGEVLEQIATELARGNRIEFRGFGVFDTKVKAARVAQNPRTLAPVEVPQRRTVRFKPGSEMKATVDGVNAPAKKSKPKAAREPKLGTAPSADGLGEPVAARV
ncbi:MAG: integration host factor subunit beta [Phycisphaerales bacterium]|nr:integration host factor subunit beta [Phycisphaerales bacterium]